MARQPHDAAGFGAEPDAALAAGAVELIGDGTLLADFTATFTVPFSDALLP